MIVLLKSNWFDGAKFYEKGRIDYAGAKELLPSDAIILSEDGTLPVASNTPKAGFGAKPMEEQIMDLAGMGPTHQLNLFAGSSKVLTEEETQEREVESLTARAEAAQKQRDQAEAAIDALRKETETGIAAAQAAFDKIEPSIDPLKAVQETGPETPTETPPVTPEPVGGEGSSGEDPIATPVVIVGEAVDPFKPAKKK